jgi:organic hydroperoxide reductase OsmC/OhrA
VEGDIEDVNGILKITRIRVGYHLKIPKEKAKDAQEAFSTYLVRCPAAQSVIGCIRIEDKLIIEEEG